ncbi:MAG: glycerol-3-phosphate acyltransferase [Acidimicrobiia bacterium]|nr:glycerol-3-phosphate acyltransferase [Acidimicrobiia bacterium]MDH5237146.1 glycerol-3-phosphate acyltransferase [Acidimicrobiia bacterium]
MWRSLAAAAIGYLAGTFPSAELAVGAATHGELDVHEAGTGNPGALNTSLAIGKTWGAAVLVADVGKGVLAARIGHAVAGDDGAHAAAAAAVIGHCYPVWYGFRGGKGVATSVGQVLGTFPAYVPIDIAVAGTVAAVPSWTRRTFAATVAASVAWVGSSLLWWRKGWPNLWGPPPSAALPIAAAVSSTAILIRFLQEGVEEVSAG